MSEEKIRILVVDDHEVVRRGIRALLTTEAGFEVIGEATNGREAVDAFARLAPDVVLMDIVMPEMDGIEAIQRIRADHPRARILVLTSFSSDSKLLPAVKAGATGYLLKDVTPEEFLKAIRYAAEGRTFLHPSVGRRLLEEFSGDRTIPRPSEELTERESEILRNLARGLSNRQIGEVLCISEATVRTHVSHILGKLNLASRTQAVLYALKEGLASLDDARW